MVVKDENGGICNSVPREESPAAITASNAIFSYSRSDQSQRVLQGANIHVPRSVIYALLGPSGCGKTTLLKAIAGLIKLDQGDISVFGQHSSKGRTNIPGPNLGYMPQDLALYDKFKVSEMILMFGKLGGCKSNELRQRYAELELALSLSPKNQLIKELSGGQKRRVSLACALIHSPSLLILDEPTVGVDPVLRKVIWKYLHRLTQSIGSTILITTHYIEEARQADKIGMMRNGRLLVESSPSILMKHFNSTTLESCVVEICKCEENQVNLDLAKLNVKQSPTKSISKMTGVETEWVAKPSNNWRTIRCLTRRNLVLLKRNVLHLFFEMALPAFQVMMFCICIGGRPFDLPISVVNDESPKNFSSLFLDHLDRKIVQPNSLDGLSSATQLVQAGKSEGVLHIGTKFSQCLAKKILHYVNVDNETILCGSISAQMDSSNYLKVSYLKSSFFASYQSFLNDVYVRLGISVAQAQPILDFSSPIYGSFDVTFTEYLLPSLIVSAAYHMSLITTAFTFITENKSGIYERFRMSGVTFFHILTSHFLTELIIMVVDTVFLIVIPFWAYGFQAQGSLSLLVALIALQGLIGMTFGIMISSITSNENTALTIMNGMMYPLVFLSGFFWPIEGMPTVFRVLSYFTSMTLPTKAFRSIMSRGWGLENASVQYGFLVSFAYILFNVSLIVFIHKLKK